MHSLRRAACRLLSSPAPLPVRSRLTAVSNVHRLAIPRRTFTQCRWVGDEAKSQLESKDAALTTSATATTTTTTTTSTKNDALEESVEVETEKIEEVVDQNSAAGLDAAATTAATATTTATTNDAPDSSTQLETKETERVIDQVVEDSPDATHTTGTASTTSKADYEPQSLLDIDPSQIRDAATESEEQREAQKAAKRELIRQARHIPKETVYIGNLFYDVTAGDLKEQMMKYGVVEKVNIVYDSRGISRGYGYVHFDSISSARRAIEAMHMRIYQGRRVTMHYALSSLMENNRKINGPSSTLYVGNMPFEMTDRDLNDLFKDIANVIDVRVSVDRRTGHFKGYVHAEFTDVESASAGFERLGQRTPYGRRLRIDYGLTRKDVVFPVAG
ncbi:hypothetical protein BDW59DRAFT_140010 [Aspergillus cavernicola]|uniref:RRM domain-containing protein n=1 Tax=Aspergillus cavernicola TaxID=176166 RepID=A0ABR4IVK5_9EURO